MNYFSKNLKWFRENRGVGQAELAEILEVSRNNVASYERGSVPKLEIMLKIVKLFHTTLEDMIEKDFQSIPPSENNEAVNAGRDRQTPQSEDTTVESLQKLIKVQEKYIKTLEDKIEAGSKSSG